MRNAISLFSAYASTDAEILAKNDAIGCFHRL
jgi:hypothetical protein